MNIAAAIALAAATVHLGVAALLGAISTAPGWRQARMFALIALSAGIYAAAQVLMCVDGFPDALYGAAGRLTYAVASLHSGAWLAYSFGGPEARFSAMPRWTRRLAALLALLGLVVPLLPAFAGPPVPIEVAWAGVRYHYPVNAPLSDALGGIIVAVLILAVANLGIRAARGERHPRWIMPGMLLFLLCALDELLVASRVISFLSLADLGFLALVLPLSIEVVRRYGADSRRLETLTHRLEEEVRERTERLDRAKEALTRSERVTSLGRMAAGVSHEINNPLSWMRVALDDVGRHLEATAAPADVQDALGEAREGLARIQGVAERLRSQVRSEGIQRGILDLEDVVRKALELAPPEAAGVRRVELAITPVARLAGDAPRLAQALANLIANGTAAVVERGGERTLTVRTRALPGGEVCLEVEDDGVGIRPEHLSRLGEPYFTTRADRGALGLGLFVARGIAEAHGGRLEIESRPLEWTRARLVLPPAAQAVQTFSI